jgi:putative colanic acid biosynthesis UDP-glucose lipid carrier transferase
MDSKIKPFTSVLTTSMRIVDALITTTLLPAVAICFGSYHRAYLSACPFVFLLTLVTFKASGLYQTWRTSSVREEIQQMLLGCFLVYAGLFASGFILKISYDYSRRVVLTWVIVMPVFLAIDRYCLRYAFRYFRKKGKNSRRVVIAGAGELTRRLIHAIESNPWYGIEIVCLFDDKVTGEECGYSIAGRLDSILAYVKTHAVDIVYIALPMRAESKIEMLIRVLSDSTASIRLVPDFFIYEMLMGGSISLLENIPIIGIRESPYIGINAVFKRIEDIVFGSLILLLASPVMLLAAIAIKLTSRGQIIFKQWRYGLNGKLIRVYKFRTMTVCEDGLDLKQATRCDQRVTPVGRFLRKTSIDELPQFVNVLQGRMSIVGPRPHAVAHNEQYRKSISGYMLRHKVKPGITGLAQVNGWRGETDTIDKMEMRINYDLEYLRNWSILLDLAIITKTIFNNWWSSNAY